MKFGWKFTAIVKITPTKLSRFINFENCEKICCSLGQEEEEAAKLFFVRIAVQNIADDYYDDDIQNRVCVKCIECVLSLFFLISYTHIYVGWSVKKK